MKSRSSSRGMVLVVSLLLLVCITLLAMTALNSAVLQEKMASNERDTELARQINAATLQQAIRQLPNAQGASWFQPVLPTPVQGGLDWWQQPAAWIGAGQAVLTLDGQNYVGEFLVENMGLWPSRQNPNCNPQENALCERVTYRITVRNQPQSGRASVVSQVIWRN